MDYSPYRKQSRSVSANSSAGIVMVFIVSSIIGFFLFWGIKSLFFSDGGTIVLPAVQQNEAGVSVQIKGVPSWSTLEASETDRVLSEGDAIKVDRGEGAAIIFENGTAASLGLGGKVSIQESRKNDKGELFGDIRIDSDPVVFTFDGSFDADEEFKVWVSDNIYINGSKGKVLITSNAISLLEGETMEVIQTDEQGKILKTKTLGIGQSLDIQKFALQGIPESVKHLPLYILHTKGAQVSPEPNASPTPVPTAVIVDRPTITTPNANGEIVTVKNVPQLLQGTAPENAKKIMVEWENSEGKLDEYVLKNFTGAQKTWKYSASPQFNTIAPGKNIYRVYAFDAQGIKSEPASIIIVYEKSETTENIYTTAKGDLVITSPNGGKDTTQSSPKITLRGTAPTNASYITVINSTLGSAYTLQQFRLGNSSWLYLTGEMNPGTYNFVVKAQNAARQTLSSDTIAITITGDASVSTPSPSPVVTASPTTTTPVPTASVSPTPMSATLEASRQ